MPHISVIIPAYNAEKTIKQTVRSVLSQTFDDFEIIVINSSSSDSTLAVLSTIEDNRIRIFTYPKANVAVNRNRGLKFAAGEYVSFLDADDLWMPDKLELQHKALESNPGAAVAYSWTDAIDENGKFLRKYSHDTRVGDVYSNLLLANFIASGSNILVRKSALCEINGFDETLTNAHIIDISLKLAAKYNFVAVDKVQVLYRIHPNSMSSNLLGMEKSYLTVLERAFLHDKAASFQYLKRHSIANLYKYLAYKVLENPADKFKPLQAINFVLKSILYDPYLLIKPIIYKALLKIVIVTFLPTQLGERLLKKYPNISKTSTFMGYAKIN